MKTAILLAAGKGRKIWPYSPTNAKVVLPVANEPIIARQVRLLVELGVEKVLVVGGYRANQVRWALRGSPATVVEAEAAGAGSAAALDAALRECDGEQFLVVYGDTVWAKEEMASFLENARRLGPGQAFVGLLPFDRERPQDWICARVTDGLVRVILGHPRDDVTHRFAGAFALGREIERYLTAQPEQLRHVQVGMMPPDELTLEGALAEFIADGGEVIAHEVRGPWFDIDKPWHWLEANDRILRHEGAKLETSRIAPDASVSDAAEIEGPIVVESGAVIGPGVKILGPAWIGRMARITDGAILEGYNAIGEEAVVRRYCQVEAGSSIGPRCVVGHAAEFSGIMLEGAYAYHYGEYWGILGAKSDLGAATVCGNLRFDDDETIHNVAGHREKPAYGANAAYLGDFVRTGVNVIIMPGVKVGPYSVIGPGTIVSEDVPDGSLIYVEQQIVRKKWGPERYGW